MKCLAIAVLTLGATFSVPVQALEHRETIDHPAAGPIAADYRGTTAIATAQTGTTGPGGRAATLRCNWSVSLTVERTAVAGSGLQASRAMTRDGALKGSLPGWCSSNGKEIGRIVEAKRATLREAMMAMVAQDRAVILVEADGVHRRAREG